MLMKVCWTNWFRRLWHLRASGWGQGVVNMTAPHGLGNARATGLVVNLWTTWQHPCQQCNCTSADAKCVPLRKEAIKRAGMQPEHTTEIEIQRKEWHVCYDVSCLAWPSKRSYLSVLCSEAQFINCLCAASEKSSDRQTRKTRNLDSLGNECVCLNVYFCAWKNDHVMKNVSWICGWLKRYVQSKCPSDAGNELPLFCSSLWLNCHQTEANDSLFLCIY